ncbi:hypothetical protein KY346_02755 [Candidatus Woesearchaeota archaeon]|nr:hypothetical protein [Candidatus Woesearchaeota archaeon]
MEKKKTNRQGWRSGVDIMQDANSVKSAIEKTNIDYLCNNFNLQEIPYDVMQAEGFKPDLFGLDSNHEPQCIFELKSRTFPKKQTTLRQRPQTDYEWWRADPRQIRDYEKYASRINKSLFWIFILAHASEQLSRTESINEKTVKKRDIYVVPWEIHMPIPVTDGGVKNMGLARIKKEYTLLKHSVKKGELFVPKSMADDITAHFIKENQSS